LSDRKKDDMINHLKWQASSLMHLIGLCKVYEFKWPYYAQNWDRKRDTQKKIELKLQV